MSRPYDDSGRAPPPPPVSPLEAVQLVSIGFEGESRTAFRFNMAHFTRGLLCGNDADEQVTLRASTPLHEKLDRVPLGNLARWVYQREQVQWTDDGDGEDVREQVLELVHNFRSLDYINGAMLDAIGGDGIVGRLWEEHPTEPGSEVALLIEHGADGMEGFEAWYGDEVRRADAVLVSQECAQLRASLGRALRELERATRARNKVAQDAMPLMQKFRSGQTILEVVEAFGTPPDERPKRAPWREFKDERFVVPQPDAGWRQRHHDFMNVGWKTLLDVCAEVVRAPVLSKKVDIAAMGFVEALRDEGAPYLSLMEKWDSLLPGSRAELKSTLRRGIELTLRSPEARDALLDGELNTLARVAAESSTAAGPGRADPARAALTEEIENFDPNALGSEQQTPLGKVLAQTWTGPVAGWTSRGGLVLEILGLATPHVTARLKARGSKHAQVVAWAWRTLVGSTNLNLHEEGKFFEWFFDISWGPKEGGRDFTQWRLFDHEEGLLKSAYKKGAVYVQFANVVARVLLIHHAVHEYGEASDEEEHVKWLEVMDQVAGAAAAGLDLGARVAGKEFGSRLFSVSKQSGKTVASPTAALSVVADTLSFMISTEKYRLAKSLRKSARAREKAGIEMVLDVLKLALTVIGAVAGSEFVLLGMAIWGVKNAILDLDSWVPHIPFVDIQPKPATQQLLIGLLRGMQDEGAHDFWRIMRKLEPYGGANISKQMELVLDRLENPVASGTEFMWDVAPPRSNVFLYGPTIDQENRNKVKTVVRAEWGVEDEQVLDALVQHCSHKIR